VTHCIPSDRIQVFLLAENRFLREALARMLGQKADLRVVGATGLTPQILDLIVQAGPDVLLSDSAVNSLSGLQIIPEVRRAVPGLKVVMIGMEDNSETFLHAVRDGVVGYVLKEASAAEIVSAIRSVAGAGAVCPAHLCLKLFECMSSQWSQLPSYQIRHDLGLTRREQQMVHMISHGLTNKEIASQLNLSEQTVKNHVHRMLRKVGASDRLAVVEICRMQGLAI